MNKHFTLSTTKSKEIINITEPINEIVKEAGIPDGICLIFVPHATCALLINEDEPGFKADVAKLVSDWIPEGTWKHNEVDQNATAHLGSALIGQSKAIPISGGGLQLGTWQQIFLVELDGPRENRKVIVQINPG